MFILLLPFIPLLIYFYLTKNHDYWAKRNVKHDRPVPLFGNLFNNIIGKKSITEVATEMYNKYPNEKVVGLYHGTIPELIIRDLDIAKRILTADFSYFYPRGLGRDTEKEPSFLNLFHVDGDTWKLLRQRLTPAFTTSKLKKMFPLVVECAEKLREMDLNSLAAQVLVFFAAGFETSSSATSYMLHELAFYPEEQIKIQEEINLVLAKYNNKLCYDSVAEMTLLNMGLKEAMRKFPSLGNLHRECAKRYTISELGITLDPGVKIIIPVQAIQNDENYFDNPSEFKPARFNDTSKLRHKYSYLPFAEGPRSCIGK